jgi:hypothetical protein
MSWANLDDRLHAHPKVRRLQRMPFSGPEAFGIWAWCLSWCRAYSPADGRVTVEDVAVDWNADPEHMAQVFGLLHYVGLVDPDGEVGVYVIHDWADWQLEAHSKAGKANAATARRGPGGRFTPKSTIGDGAMVGDGEGDGHHRATPLHATPHRTSPDGRDMKSLRETLTEMGLPQ